jgi:hypothetical protein
MVDEKIFEDVSEGLDGNYSLEAKLLAVLMPFGW